MTGGERWAATELGLLRAARFTPAAWVRFLLAAFRQAAQTGQDRPALVRQARAWSTVGLLSAVTTAKVSSRVRLAGPRVSRFAAWWLLVGAMLEWHLGMVEGPAGESRERLSAADALTLQRMWLIPLLTAQSDRKRGSPVAFTALVASAGAGDVLDGVLARRAGPTRLGRDLDKAADTLLVSAAAHTAQRAGWLPPHAARLAHVRGGLPVVHVAVSYFATGQRPRVDSLGAGRRLAPALLGGLAVAPFFPGLGARLTSAASIASLVLVVAPTRRPTT